MANPKAISKKESNVLPDELNKLIGDINNAGKIDNYLIKEIVDANKLSGKNLSLFENFNHDNKKSYGRRLIFENEYFKLFLISWKIGDFTAIHNHGNTEWGCVYFFGDASHRSYKIIDDEILSFKKGFFYEGQNASVCSNINHMMGNSSSKEFATLHIYGSNKGCENISENSKVYLPECLKVVTSKGPAYLNMDKDLIITEKQNLKISPDVLLDYCTLVKSYYERTKQFEIIHKLDDFIKNNIMIDQK